MMGVCVFFGLLWMFVVFEYALGKECTNIPTQLSSHTFRYNLLSSRNETLKKEVFSQYHLNHAEESTWMDLLPRKLLVEEYDWAMLYRSIKNSDGYSSPTRRFLKEFSLHDVRLDPNSKHGRAQQTNLEYLLILDVDRLVWSFRRQAGLPTPGTPYGGWEAPDVELRGHFVGHYMSAAAKMWASTHNGTLRSKMSEVVNALYLCQKKMGTGYLSAFPSEFFDRFEAIESVWAPYYTIHKIMAGLLDQYSFAGDKRALQMVVKMAGYFGDRVKNVIEKYTIERHWRSLNEETGGMNDVFYNLYTITGDQKHLTLAHLFDKPCFLGLLAMQADSLSGFHVNTHIPIVIGAQKRYEITGDPLYKEIGTFFMDVVNSSHCYATGGTSVSEFWSDPKHLADTLTTENVESCTTYNMLKVSRNLFKWTKEMAYADYYERALTNGVLSIQRGTEPGIMIYMLPHGRGVSKARSYHKWGTPFSSFWCCYGTGIESFSKLGDSIYFEETGSTLGLYIVQFISSSLNWQSGGVIINQKVDPVTSFDPHLRVRFTFSSSESSTKYSTLNIRVPFWTPVGAAKATLNSKILELPLPGKFLSVSKKWTPGDELAFEFPIGLRTEAIEDNRPEYASIQAVLFGPYLLAGLSSGEWEINTRNAHSMSDWIQAIPSDLNTPLLSLTQESNGNTLVFSNLNNSISMDKLPESGTDSSIYATFRLAKATTFPHSHLMQHKNKTEDPIMLEPFDLPGAAVAHKGPFKNLGISMAAGTDNSLFYMVPGLDGKPGTASLEAFSEPGCFAYGDTNAAGGSVQLVCAKGEALEDTSFRHSTSFIITKGAREYNPISFVAAGSSRNYLLEPLMSLRDETYTAYFYITT